MKYKTTWAKGMNTRPQPNVSNSPNGAVPYNTEVEGAELWTASADGANVRKGDKWMRLVSSIVQWVAVVHMGTVYGVVTETTPEPTPEPEPVLGQFPDYFDLTDPQGVIKRYTLVS